MQNKLTVLGLDISTKTGYAVVGCSQEGLLNLDTRGIITSKLKGFDRWADMATQLLRVLNDHSPGLVVVEGYGFANKHTLVTLVEVGTVLRYFLWQENVPYVNIPPTTLKKFVTGKGNAKKDLMIKEIYKRWRHDVESNDEADAIGLAYLGMALNRVDVGLPKVNMSAIAKVKLI